MQFLLGSRYCETDLLGNTWQTFDSRNDAPQTGRILMARGRDAADVAISNTFGTSPLTRFRVVCEPQ
ncbi:MAG TPA: hypothetical protein VMJ11_18285 [Paraburkholderia sp.]|uniref:hypothetical protein n=1 Tax=Paraburkholderia sp. TaxID=1926495 RepID=UPI002BC5E196|nr:hypothetical protein [Paraburkholderia sp.]HTR08560.1 hypothetical protein [Paraburkholderia sp.]